MKRIYIIIYIVILLVIDNTSIIGTVGMVPKFPLDLEYIIVF